MNTVMGTCNYADKKAYEELLKEYNDIWTNEFSKLISEGFDMGKTYNLSINSITRNDVGNSPENVCKKYLTPIKIIYNDKSTICYFKDGSKEIVHCAEGEQFIKEVGVMSCIMKKLFNSRNEFKRLVESGYEQPKKTV